MNWAEIMCRDVRTKCTPYPPRTNFWCPVRTATEYKKHVRYRAPDAGNALGDEIYQLVYYQVWLCTHDINGASMCMPRM